MGGTKRINPTHAEVATWLKQIKPELLQDTGWIKIIRRFPGITEALQPYIEHHYSDTQDNRAALEGAILALVTIAHFEDVDRLEDLFTAASVDETADQGVSLGVENADA